MAERTFLHKNAGNTLPCLRQNNTTPETPSSISYYILYVHACLFILFVYFGRTNSPDVRFEGVCALRSFYFFFVWDESIFYTEKYFPNAQTMSNACRVKYVTCIISYGLGIEMYLAKIKCIFLVIFLCGLFVISDVVKFITALAYAFMFWTKNVICSHQ